SAHVSWAERPGRDPGCRCHSERKHVVHSHCNADASLAGKGKIQALVFPCGAENAIEVHRALRYSVHVDLHGASSVDDHGSYQFDSYYGDLPNIQHPEFEAAFSALISRLNIDVVFATHD